MTPLAYLARFAAFTLGLALLVVFSNWLIDPYAIFGAKRIAGINQYKTDINNYTRLSKRYQPQLHQYSALVVGNSRVEMGINPAHSCFQQQQWQVYNLGLPGAGVATQLEYALNIIYQQPIKHVLLSVDFTDFISRERRAEQSGSALLGQGTGQLRYLPSGEANPGYFRVRAADYYKSLFTLGALTSSVATLVAQSERGADRDISGFNPARDFADAVSAEGPGALFAQKMNDLRRKYSSQWSLRDAGGNLDTAFEDIAVFLSIAARRGIEVHVFTNPFHEEYWQLLRQNGLLRQYRDWIESLEGLVLKHRAGPVSLWDFSLDSPYIHEPVPAEGVRGSPLEWFWEPAHYRQELGNLMVDTMLSDRCDTEPLFGRKIL